MDIEALKAAWKAEGLTGYEIANRAAEWMKDTHHQRMAALVEAHAARHPLCYDDGYGQADAVKVEERAAPSWWQDSPLWVQGRPTLCTIVFKPTPYVEIVLNGLLQAPTEVEAVENVRAEAKVMELATLRRRQRERWAAYRLLVKEVMAEAQRAVKPCAERSVL